MSIPSTGVLPTDLPYEYGATVTPSDITGFAVTTNALWVGGAGNVVVAMVGDKNTVTFTGVPAGTLLRVRAVRVNATNTTATNIIALW